MFFGIGFSEMLIIAFVAMVMFGPDRLPELARSAARLVVNLRRLAAHTQEELRRELGPEFADLQLTDLDPRQAIRRHVLEPIQAEINNATAAIAPPSAPRLPAGERPPFDPDAT